MARRPLQCRYEVWPKIGRQTFERLVIKTRFYDVFFVQLRDEPLRDSLLRDMG